MGQTLTHGVYLPDEGERNCYSGLAANWQILDTSVGTIAEHTTALAGKAPAVHTHTKSDVTDLLNSNFIPSANNTYDLGSSSYQWNNLYAKNYYYNGVAWGLDKANVWSQINNFKTLRLYGVAGNNLVMYPPSGEKGDSSTFGFNIICSDKNLGNYNTSGVANVGMGQSNGTSYVALNASTKGSIDTNIHSVQIGLQIAASDNANIGSFYPTQNGGINLGTSTNKWKTLNGINPGALSLPRGYTEEGADKHYINIASVIQTLDGTLYYYTMPDNGWISIRAEQANQVHVTTDNWKFGQSIYSNTVTTLIVSTPFRKGDIVALKVIAITLEHARFYPMQGNV